MRKFLLKPTTYKIVTYMVVLGLIAIIVLPLLHCQNFAYWLIFAYIFIWGDWLCTFFQRRSVHWLISIVLGSILSLALGLLLILYAAYVGNI